MSSSRLTSKDARVLSALLNPEATSDTPSKQTDRSLAKQQVEISPYPNVSDHALPDILAAERAALLPLNEATYPSSEVINTTLDSLSSLIARFPSYPPAYVNRAQARRILWQKTVQNNPAHDSTNNEMRRNNAAEAFNSLITNVFADLDEAIRLTSPLTSDFDGDESNNSANTKSPITQKISQEQARVLGIAKCHRGYTLLQLAARAPITPCETKSSQSSQLRQHLQALSKAQLEEDGKP